MIIIIDGRLPSLNEVINTNRGNKYAGNKMKKETDAYIQLCIKSQCRKKFDRISISFKWYEPNRRRDFDNIASGKKFILDALVKTGVIPNDGWKNIAPKFTDEFYYDKDNPRVEIDIKEIDNEKIHRP